VIVPDINLLLYAYDRDSPFHHRAREWWQDCLSGEEAIGLTHATIFGFIRISTSGRIFPTPLTLAQAVTHVDAWLERRVSQVLEPQADYHRQVVELLERAGGTAGNLVSDAQIAALAKAYRAVVHTSDRDFLRFPDVHCHFPLDD
jgi:toxin-antitoxin system PIN domain toxin